MSDWRERAACAGHDQEIFYPGKGETARPAKTICAGCPVIDECLAFILAAEAGTPRAHRHGIWAGLNGAQRWALERRGKATRVA